MARKAVIERELRRETLCNKTRTRRQALKAKIAKLRLDPGSNYEKLQQLLAEFQGLPRNTSPTRLRRRCQLTGRSRGVYRKFGLARSMLRIHAMNGDIPGLIKSSW